MSDETHPDSPSGQPYSAPSELHFEPRQRPAVHETFTVLPPDYEPEPPAVPAVPQAVPLAQAVPLTRAWGGNADPHNLSYGAYEGARYFGPGYEQPNDTPWEGGEVLGEEARQAICDALSGEIDVWRMENVSKIVAVFLAPHVAALVAEARDTFAAADSEQDRLAEWVLANCPGEPSQDGSVVDTVIRLITSARADGAAEVERNIRNEIKAARRDEREQIEQWLRKLADGVAETNPKQGSAMLSLAADVRWAANRLAEDYS